MYLQDVILALHRFWAGQGCLIAEPYDIEKGAGTMSPHTFFRALGPEPWAAAYVEPSRRPADARYGENPNRLGHYYQYQALLKPSPDAIQDLYLASLAALGLVGREHDIRFVEDNWENATLGAWGLGWEVWLDGMEVTQFTYFQQCAGVDWARRRGLRWASRAPRARMSGWPWASSNTICPASPRSFARDLRRRRGRTRRSIEYASRVLQPGVSAHRLRRPVRAAPSRAGRDGRGRRGAACV